MHYAQLELHNTQVLTWSTYKLEHSVHMLGLFGSHLEHPIAHGTTKPPKIAYPYIG